MGLPETCEPDIDKFVGGIIWPHVEDISYEQLHEDVQKITEMYSERAGDALMILASAADQGKFEEYFEKLETNYKSNLQFVHPKGRNTRGIPGVERTHDFILECYDELGIL